MNLITGTLGLFVYDIKGNFELIFAFGAEGNIGTSILPRRKSKKELKELEYQTNKPKVQVHTNFSS